MAEPVAGDEEAEWRMAGSSGQRGGGQSRVGHLRLLVLRMHAMLA